MKLSVHHSTTYRYADPVARSTQYIRLTPSQNARQRVDAWQLDMPTRGIRLLDAFENVTHLLTMSKPHQSIAITATGTVEVPDTDDGEEAGRVNPQVFLRSTPLTEASADIEAFCDPMRGTVEGRPLIGASDLMMAVRQKVPFKAGITDSETPASDVFQKGGGVYQDQAHVFLACCRHLGLPARYVSGYVFSADRSDVRCRAWTELWLSHRWVSFDVGLGGARDGGRFKLAVGLDYLDACPMRGMRVGGGEEALSTKAQVRKPVTY